MDDFDILFFIVLVNTLIPIALSIGLTYLEQGEIMKTKVEIDIENEVTINTENMSEDELKLFYITLRIFADTMKGDLNMTIPDKHKEIVEEIEKENY